MCQIPSRGVLGLPENTTSFPKLRAINSPNVGGERENAPRRPGASLSPSLAACFSNLPTRGADVQPPAAGNRAPAFSVSAGLSSREGRARARGGRATWAPGPRRGGQAAAPRTQAPPKPKHTRTHARARRPIHSPGGVGRRFHSSSFIPQRRGSLHPGASIPPSQGAPRGPIAPRVLSARTHPDTLALQHDRQRRPRTGAAASPAPHSFAAPLPLLPAAAPLRPAARRSPRPASRGRHRREAPATPESRRLRSHGRQPGGSRGRRAERKEEGAGSKSSGSSGPGRAPVSSHARPRGVPSRNRVPQASVPAPAPPPASST